MARTYTALAFALLLALQALVQAQQDYVLIEDYYDTGSCVCATSGDFVNGTVALAAGDYIVYRADLTRVEEVALTAMVVLENGSLVALWMTSSDVLSYGVGAIDPGVGMVGPGVSVVVYEGVMYVLATTAVGAVKPSVLAVIDISAYVHETPNGTVAVRVSVSYGLVGGGSAYLEVAVWGSRVFSSDISYTPVPFAEPRYVALVADGGDGYAAYVDFVCARFSSSSSRRVPDIHVSVAPIVLPSAVTIWLHNSTHLVVSYTCYYATSVDECETISIQLSDANMTRVYNITAAPRELFRGVAVFRGYAPVPSSVVLYRVCVDGECEEGRFSIPTETAAGDQYVWYVFRVLPLAVVVALAAKTGGMKGVGLGLVGSGLVVLLLPWLFVTPPGVYAVSVLLMSLGIVVLTFYRD